MGFAAAAAPVLASAWEARPAMAKKKAEGPEAPGATARAQPQLTVLAQ
jgi:hypothetical protein